MRVIKAYSSPELGVPGLSEAGEEMPMSANAPGDTQVVSSPSELGEHSVLTTPSASLTESCQVQVRIKSNIFERSVSSRTQMILLPHR